MYLFWHQKKSYQIPQFKSKKLRFLWHFWGISHWLLQRYIHWGKWRRGALWQVACTFCRMALVMGGWREGRWRAPPTNVPWHTMTRKKTMFRRYPHFSTSTKKTLELKKWSFLTKWSFLMSGILKIGMLKCLKDWSITYSPATRLERVLPWTGCGFLDLFCGLRQGIKKTQDWDLFGVLPFWSSIGSLLFDLYVRHVQMVEILGVTY